MAPFLRSTIMRNRIFHHHRTTLSVLLALTGLICAGAAAALILYAARPPSTVLELVQDVEDTIEVEQVTVLDTQWLRRRLLQNDNLDAIPAPTLVPSTAPSEMPSHYPTQIVIYDNVPPKDSTILTSSGGNNDGANVVATETIPAIMVGLASSIIVCALLLYASDLRDRHRHERWVHEQHRAHEMADDNSSQKSACVERDGQSQSMTSAGSSESGFWVRVNHQAIVEYKGSGGGENGQNMLPPMLADGDADAGEELKQLGPPEDDVSISRVSTLTTSLVEGGGWSYADIEDRMSRFAIESSSDVTELSDKHRVSGGTDLTTLINNYTSAPEDHDVSVCSSLTNGSNTTTSTPNLLGEKCLEGKDGEAENGMNSLEVSPDVPRDDESSDERNDTENDRDQRVLVRRGGDEFSQLEQLIAGIPFDEMSEGAPSQAQTTCDNKRDGPEESGSVEAFVRDIYFVPCNSQENLSLGLDMHDASSRETHVRVASVDPSSPLVGRVFVGDSILKVNDVDAVGLKSREVMQLVEGTHAVAEQLVETSTVSTSKMTKLTVMSSETDGGSLSDSLQSLDLGEPESLVEM